MDGTIVLTDSEDVVLFALAAANAKAAKVFADNGWKEAEQDCLESFIDNGVKTAVVEMPDGTLTRVTAEGLNEVSRSIDMDKALALLNDEQIKAVATLAISLSAVDAAVKTGIIPAALAEQFIGTKQTKPSVRVTFNVKNVDAKK